MKKAALLLLCGALVFCACQKDNGKDTPSKDAELTGEKVDISSISTSFTKVFVLNEGGMGSNNASLDFLRKSDASYVTGTFKKMNPEVAGGLGDVSNDVAVNGDQLWIIVNNSGIVEVVSAKDETEIAAIQVPTPRNIAFDDKYAYVTSWAGAYATYTYNADLGYSTITDSKNPKGQLYRIDLKTLKVDKQVEVGYQPEGVACYGGKIYVANSGGISSQLPPNYSYDNTVSIIDAASFTVSATVQAVINMKYAFADGKGLVYLSTFGDYYSVHSGLYALNTADNKVTKMGDFASVAAFKDGTVYCIGNENEFDYTAAAKWKTWKCSNGSTGAWNPGLEGATPYGICVLDADNVLIGDAGDYFNPGTVSLYSKGAKAWSVTAGVCPGHFAIY